MSTFNIGDVHGNVIDNKGTINIYNGNKLEENNQTDVIIEEAVVVNNTFMRTDTHAQSMIEVKLKEIFDLSKKSEIWGRLYRLQDDGMINLDKYSSDEERASIINQYQTKHNFSADDVQRGRTKYRLNR